METLDSLPVQSFNGVIISSVEFALYLFENTFIRFGNKLYWQTLGIPMRTNCAPLVADLFLSFFFFFFFFFFFLF